MFNCQLYSSRSPSCQCRSDEASGASKDSSGSRNINSPPRIGDPLSGARRLDVLPSLVMYVSLLAIKGDAFSQSGFQRARVEGCHGSGLEARSCPRAICTCGGRSRRVRVYKDKWRPEWSGKASGGVWQTPEGESAHKGMNIAAPRRDFHDRQK